MPNYSHLNRDDNTPVAGSPVGNGCEDKKIYSAACFTDSFFYPANDDRNGVAQPVAPAVFCSWHGGSCGDAFNAQFVSQHSNKSSPIVPRK